MPSIAAAQIVARSPVCPAPLVPLVPFFCIRVNITVSFVLRGPAHPRNTSLFLWTGIGGQLGLTFHRANELDLSFSVGNDAKRMTIDPETGEENAELAMSAGMFIDRRGALLASVHVSEVRHRLIRINVYPRVLPILGDFGAWFVMSRDLEFSIGLSNSRWLGLGVGVSQ